ncbi:MAG: DUF3606 domain-containing protein [Bacteroidota bacterium]|nr:DUF3606 domain-containing protein [Bacteroidota bacterium]
MPDNKTLQSTPDNKRINPNEDYEMDYWSQKFNVSRQELKHVIDQVGTSAERVESQIKRG